MKRSSLLKESGQKSARGSIDQLIEGVKRFQQTTFEENRSAFEELALGQRPHTLVITCADSRLRPNQITGSEVGDLFITRNIANLVPPYDCPKTGRFATALKSALTRLIAVAGRALGLSITGTGEVGAVVEYAVKVLTVKHIVIMGHTDCGGIKALLRPERLADLPAVSAWLTHAEDAKGLCGSEQCGALQAAELAQKNVLLQMQHLLTYPAVQAALEIGKLQLHGWLYHVESGRVSCFDEERREWRTL